MSNLDIDKTRQYVYYGHMLNIKQEQVSTAYAKQHLSSLINQVAYGRRRIVVTSRNRPKVAIVNLDDLELIEQKTRQQQNAYRTRAFQKADRLHDRISTRLKNDPVDILTQQRHAHTSQLLDSLH